MPIVRIRTCAPAAIIAAAALGLLAQPAAAQGKPWKHALLNAKADAGFFMMSAKRGFAEKQGLKLDLLQVKDDQIGLKALIAGEVDSFEGGPQGAFAAAARGADVKIIGCHWVVVPHGIYVRDDIHKVEDLKGKSIAVSSPNTMPDLLARSALAKYGVTRRPGEARRRRRRPRALSGAGRRRGRGRRGVERIPAGDAQDPASAGRRPRRGAEFPARLPDDQRQGPAKSAATTSCASSPPRCRRCVLRCRTRPRRWR